MRCDCSRHFTSTNTVRRNPNKESFDKCELILLQVKQGKWHTVYIHTYIYISVCVCIRVSLCTYVLVILLAASRCACRLKVMLVMASWWAMPWGCGEEEAPTSSSSCCSPAFAVPILLSHARCCKAPFVLRLVWTLHDLHKFTFAFLEPSRLAA